AAVGAGRASGAGREQFLRFAREDGGDAPGLWTLRYKGPVGRIFNPPYDPNGRKDTPSSRAGVKSGGGGLVRLRTLSLRSPRRRPTSSPALSPSQTRRHGIGNSRTRRPCRRASRRNTSRKDRTSSAP